MANTTTEQVQNSKDKKIIQNISFKDFIEICSEEKIVEKAIKELFLMASDVEMKPKLRADIFRWIIEMNIGKPRQCNAEPPTSVTIEDILASFEPPPEPNKPTGFKVEIVTAREEIERLEKLREELTIKESTSI
jgi:hypothetical protein